jgi:hypothetical protein
MSHRCEKSATDRAKDSDIRSSAHGRFRHAPEVCLPLVRNPGIKNVCFDGDGS